MGNAASGREKRSKRTHEEGEGEEELLRALLQVLGLSKDEEVAFACLARHWQVDESELAPADDDDVSSLAQGCAAKFKDQVSVVRWRGDLLVLKRCGAPAVLAHELAVWFRLRPHTRVVGFRGVVLGSVGVLTDYVPLGTLEALVQSPAAPPLGGLAWLQQGVSLLLDVAHAMAHLHAERFVWRDCAGRNILLANEDGDDHLLRAKHVVLPRPLCAADDHPVASLTCPPLLITDFGFTRKMDTDGRVVVAKQNHNLPVRIGAPESLVGDAAEYSAKSDVWAFGVLIYSLFARKRPYGDLSADKVVQGVIDGSLSLSADDLVLRSPPPADTDKKEKWTKRCKQAAKELRRLFEACLRHEPQDRPTAANIIDTLSPVLSSLRSLSSSSNSSSSPTPAGSFSES